MIDVNTHCKLWQDLTIENVLSSAWGRKPIKNQGKNIKIQCPINCKNIVDSSIHFTDYGTTQGREVNGPLQFCNTERQLQSWCRNICRRFFCVFLQIESYIVLNYSVTVFIAFQFIFV